MPSNSDAIMQEIVEFLEGAARFVADAQRARALDGILAAAAPAVIGTITRADLWTTLKEVVQDAVSEMVEDDAFNPLEAAKPAAHLMQALDTILIGGQELRRWEEDARFKTPKPSTAPERIRDFFVPRTHPSAQPVEVPVTEITEQLAFVEPLLRVAGQEADVAVQSMMRKRDPRLRVVSTHTPPIVPSVEMQEYFIPQMKGPLQSHGDKGREFVNCVVSLGHLLMYAATRGKERLTGARLDTNGFNPGVVVAQAIAIGTVVTNALSTCNALAAMAMQSISDGTSPLRSN